MASLLHYGCDSSVRLEFADGAAVDEYGTPDARPPHDLADAVRRALAEPIGFPELARATTPGDRIAIALDSLMPRADEVAAAVVGCLVEAGVEADGITVLRSGLDVDAGASDPCRFLDEHTRRRVTLATHDPTRREEMAYLAATEAGEPILINRAIHDADLVLPVGCLRGPTAAGYHGVHGPLFPTYSDVATLSRFRSPKALDGHGRHKARLIAEVDNVGWLLGVMLTVQVVPGPGDSILNVLAGEARTVQQRGRQLHDDAWGHTVGRRAELVVAAIEGGPTEQTWQQVGRAIDTAARLVEPDGAIALCCDLATEPGPALRQMAADPRIPIEDDDNDRPDDALPAVQLGRAMDRSKVYLLSRLEPSSVEDLGMVPLGDSGELARLARRFDSCIVLANAANVAVQPRGK